jgi:hypothetical protein
VVQLSEQPILAIGGGARAEDQFAYISGVFRLSDGRVAVANSGSFEVRLYDTAGHFVKSIGRQGSGPGEFNSLYGIYRLPGDSIAAYDSQLQRMTVFASDGAVGRSFTVARSPGASRVSPVGPLGDNGWLMMFAQNAAPLETGHIRLQLNLARYDEEGKLVDTLETVPGFEVFVHEAGNERIVPSVPFGRGAVVALTGHGFVVAATDSFQIRRYDSDGQLRTIVRQEVKSRFVAAADIDAAREAQSIMFRGEQQQALLSDAFSRMTVPTTMPAIGSSVAGRAPWIVVNAGGGFWVLSYQAPTDKAAVWSVFDRSGRLHGSITLPDNFALHEVGADYVLGVSKDSFDVEQVVMYKVK